MTGSAYRFQPPHTCYNQRVATKSVRQCLFFFFLQIGKANGGAALEKKIVWFCFFMVSIFGWKNWHFVVGGRFEIYMANMLHGCLLLVRMQAELHKCAYMHVRTIKLSVCVCVWGVCLYAAVQWHLIHNADRLSLNWRGGKHCTCFCATRWSASLSEEIMNFCFDFKVLCSRTPIVHISLQRPDPSYPLQ